MVIIHGVNNLQKPLARLLEPAVTDALRRFPVVIVSGARQTGKTTLVGTSALSKGRTYRSLDDYDVLERARAQPDSLLQDADRLTLDEVQRVPELLLAIKRDVDRSRKPGRFLLTGSAQLLMMGRVSESLAGRAVYLTLWPMTEAEKQGTSRGGPWSRWIEASDAPAASRFARERGSEGGWRARVVAGGFPVPALECDATGRTQWFDGYLRTYLERDLQDLSAISSLPDFRRLMRLAAHRVGQMLNQSELARDAALAQATAHRYLNLLETSYQIVRIPAFAGSKTKRLVKTPKLYWTDTGLAAHLAGATENGAFLENLVLMQILAWRETVIPRPEVHYWRTAGGLEVDFVIEHGRRLLPIEVKSSRRLRPDDAKGLAAFLDEHRKTAPFGLVLYDGKEVIRLAKRIVAMPLGAVWG